MPFSVYKELLPPTGVEFCCTCRLYSEEEENVVVSGSTLLRVFRLRRSPTSSSTDSSTVKLQFVSQHSLLARVAALKTVRLPGHTLDSLLVTFRDAKCSILSYDPSIHDLRTSSMHRFEDDSLTDGVRTTRPTPLVAVDPDLRCVVMTVYQGFLAVIPLQDLVNREDVDGIIHNRESSTPQRQSHLINLSHVDPSVANLKSIEFLHGYHLPTLAILHEPVRAFAGRVAMRQDTCMMTAVSINIAEKCHPVIWSLGSLPFNCFNLIPVPKPLGGVLVLASNALIYLNQSLPPFGVSLNCLNEGVTAFPLKEKEGCVFCLDDCVSAVTPDGRIIFSLKSGEIYTLTLLTEGTRTVTDFHLHSNFSSVLASCASTLKGNYLFLGSRLDDSVLLSFTVENPRGPVEALPSPQIPPSAKRRRTGSESAAAEDLDMYGYEDQPLKENVSSLAFRECSRLWSISPIVDSAVGEPSFLSEELREDLNPDIELVCCTGYTASGAISVLHRTMRPNIISTFNLPGHTSIWSVQSGEMMDSQGPFHTFLFLSRLDSTLVLRTGDDISEVENSDFVTHFPTVYAGNVGPDRFIVQVSPTAVSLFDGVNLQFQKIVGEVQSPIVWVHSADPHLVLLTSNGAVHIMKYTLVSARPVLAYARPLSSQDENVVACCLYKSSTGLFGIDVDHNVAPSRTSGEWFVWCVTVSEQGTLRIYSVPDFQCLFCCPEFTDMPREAANTPFAGTEGIRKADPAVRKNCTEILLVNLGSEKHRPILCCIVNEEFFAYEAFSVPTQHSSDLLPVAFKKLNHLGMLRCKSSCQFSQTRRGTDPGMVVAPRMVYFENIASLSGVFVCGKDPAFFLVPDKSPPRCIPFVLDGEVTTFSPHHDVNCSHGFLYFNSQGDMRMPVLRSDLNYDSPWLTKKVLLRRTPHFLAFSRENKAYTVAVSVPEKNNRFTKFITEEKEFEVMERGPRFIYPTIERFSLIMVESTLWSVVPNATFEFDEFEQVTCVKAVALTSQETQAGTKYYTAVSTASTYGEESPSKGRIIILDINDVVPEPGQPLSKQKFKVVCIKDQKFPVTCLCAVRGHLVAAVGQRMYLWSFKDSDLIGLAFLDTQLCIHQMASIKSFILSGDIVRSIQLQMFQEKYGAFCFISKDVKPLETFSIEFLVHGSKLAFVAADAEENLIVMEYWPDAGESNHGQQLLTRADINIGALVSSMFRAKERKDASTDGAEEMRHITYLTTLEGGVGVLIPVSTKCFRRMMALQNRLIDSLPIPAGLNPKAERMAFYSNRPLTNIARSILDGELLKQLFSLSLSARVDVAKKVDRSFAQVFDDLSELDRASYHF